MHDLEGNRIAEYDYDDVTHLATLIREYVWMDGRAVAVVENGNVYFIRTDHIGRPVFATDSTGFKVWETTYLPFGGVQSSSAGSSDLRFPGQWFQSESGLHQNWMRDYDPTTGRYIQADPLGLVDGASVFGYARQNPGRYSDFRGEQSTIAIERPDHSPPDGAGGGGGAWYPGTSLMTSILNSLQNSEHSVPNTLSDFGQCEKDECQKAILQAEFAYNRLLRRIFHRQYAKRHGIADPNHLRSIREFQKPLRKALKAVDRLCIEKPPEYSKWHRHVYQQTF